MKLQKILALALAICLTLTLAACGGKEGAVYVQSVKELGQMGGIAPGDRFVGIVVSENVAEIKKDQDKTVEELLVKEGDDVKTGDKLFSYDVEELQLTLDKQRLEKEQLEATIENLKSQIADLEKQYNRAGTRDKLQYAVQIQTNQVDLKEAELNLKTKEAEVAKSEEILENATVVSPVDGRVTQISENGTDDYGNPLPYISIQQAGAYRVKGTLGELQRGGIIEGDRIRILSRTDSSTWTGTVTLVDYENPTQGNANSVYSSGKGDEMANASRYPFYVELDSNDGLLLGQHVYMEKDTGEGETTGVQLSSAFIAYNDDGSAYVWAENGRGKLEKRNITLGDYNGMMDTFQISEGLSEDDYIAFPDQYCVEGAPASHTPVVREEEEDPGLDGKGDISDMGGLDGKGDVADMGGLDGKGDITDMDSLDGAGAVDDGMEATPAADGGEAVPAEDGTETVAPEGGVG